jgi:DNA-binding response OmpR family regulator
MNRPNILVIDDEEMMFNLLKITLTPLGFDFVKGSQLEDFNALIESSNIKAVLLDYLMPKKNGIQVAEEIRQKYSSLPIIFLTSKQMTNEETKTLMALKMEYVRKPFIPQIMSGKLKEVLGRTS